MRICAVIKYPPIQGGVSAQSFWLARGLADAGHEVFVVTNADSVEDDYRILMTDDDRQWLEYVSPRGGRVVLYNAERSSRRTMHIPQSKLFVSKLAAIATEVVRRHRCDLLVTYYFEPHAVAAHLASSWTSVPYVMRHAGSDLGRLMNQRDLTTTYREILRRADGVLTVAPLHFLGSGVPADALYQTPQSPLIRQYFNAEVEPLDLGAHIQDLVHRHPGVVTNTRPLDGSLPTIGIYGKMDVVKGSFELVAALGRLAREGMRFNFVSVTHGKWMDEYSRAISEHGLDERTWILPFMPHWKVGRFIRSCTAVCFLENEFPIKAHTPGIPTEILACGTCLILSGEVLNKQVYRGALEDGRNFLLVPDPKDHARLAGVLRRVIEAPVEAREIGRRGALVDLSRVDLETSVKQHEVIFADVLGRRRGEPSVIRAPDRGLPRSRAGGLMLAASVLTSALEQDAEAVMRDYCEACPQAPPGLLDDAISFCRHVQVRVRGAQERIEWLEAARFSELLLWQMMVSDQDLVRGPFDADDELAHRDDRDGPLSAQRLRLAPLRSRWLRVGRFTVLPPSVTEAQGKGQSAEHLFLFQKLPNGRGHYFRVNRWTVELLQRCDGSKTTLELLPELQRASGVEGRVVRQQTIRALKRLYHDLILIFVEPRPRIGSSPGIEAETRWPPLSVEQ